MKAFFEGINDLFVNVLFAPYDFFRFIDSWWTANTVNWVFMLICFVAFIYWMFQLKIFDNNDEEDKSSTSHSFL